MARSEVPPMYAEVAPAIPLPPSAPATFTYGVPTAQPVPEIFTRVNIPFGRRTVPGVIVALHHRKVRYQTKELVSVSPLQLTARQAAFAQWISQTMQGGHGYTLRLFFPPGIKARPPLKYAKTSPPAKLPRALTAQAKTWMNATPARDLGVIEHDVTKRLQLLAAAAQHTIKLKRQVLVIVPEIWMVNRAHAIFDKYISGNVCAVTADLSGIVQYQIWEAVRRKDVDVVIGTQKSLWLPYQDLGLIIIDEEALPTHKLWDQYPRLHNIVGAKQLANLHQAQIIFTGSTSSLRLEYLARQQQVEVVHDRPLPVAIDYIASSFEDRRDRRMLPEEFLVKLKKWLKNKEQIVILHNALGAWQTMLCAKCHHVVRCPNCETALTVHQVSAGQELRCHHCSTVQAVPKECPACGHAKLKVFGAGSQKIITILNKAVPRAVVTELNAATKLPEAPQKKKTTGQIVVGTSAIFTKLAGKIFDRAVYVWPERSLLYPDYRSAQRTRGYVLRLLQLVPPKRPVHIVTRKFDVVKQLVGGTDNAFFERELKERSRLQYPPLREAVVLTVQGRTAVAAQKKAQQVRSLLEERELPPNTTIRGPFASFIKQRRGNYEYHILLLGELPQLEALYHGLPVDMVDIAPERIL